MTRVNPVMNPIYKKFFHGKPSISTRFADPSPEASRLKAQVLGQDLLRETHIASKGIFKAKGNYLVMHSLSLANQDGIKNAVTFKDAHGVEVKAVQGNKHLPAYNRFMNLYFA